MTDKIKDTIKEALVEVLRENGIAFTEVNGKVKVVKNDAPTEEANGEQASARRFRFTLDATFAGDFEVWAADAEKAEEKLEDIWCNGGIDVRNLACVEKHIDLVEEIEDDGDWFRIGGDCETVKGNACRILQIDGEATKVLLLTRDKVIDADKRDLRPTGTFEFENA